jgi:hypothetical protein
MGRCGGGGFYLFPHLLLPNMFRAFLSPTSRGKKGKAIPLQALKGPEGSRSLKLPDFKTIGT